MTDSPERIWMDGDIEVGEGYWTRCFEDRKPCNEPALEYLRADHALALVAEAYEVAARECEPLGLGPSIRTLTPSETLAARKARDKRVRDEALREAAEICTAAKDKRNKQRNDHPDESRDVKQRWMAGALQSQYNADAILALIEGDQTDE